MKTISASECRIPPDVFNNIVYRGERVCIERRDGGRVYLISQEDMDKIMGGALGIREMLKKETEAVGKQIEHVDYDWPGDRRKETKA